MVLRLTTPYASIEDLRGGARRTTASEPVHRREWQVMVLAHAARAQDPILGDDQRLSGL